MGEKHFRKAKSELPLRASSPGVVGPNLGAHMPESLADRFMLCPRCREEYDMRDLGEVLQHLHPSADELD
jgi:hypothetical protein